MSDRAHFEKSRVDAASAVTKDKPAFSFLSWCPFYMVDAELSKSTEQVPTERDQRDDKYGDASIEKCARQHEQ